MLSLKAINLHKLRQKNWKKFHDKKEENPESNELKAKTLRNMQIQLKQNGRIQMNKWEVQWENATNRFRYSIPSGNFSEWTFFRLELFQLMFKVPMLDIRWRLLQCDSYRIN